MPMLLSHWLMSIIRMETQMFHWATYSNLIFLHSSMPNMGEGYFKNLISLGSCHLGWSKSSNWISPGFASILMSFPFPKINYYFCANK
jgi:hypothetical protein